MLKLTRIQMLAVEAVVMVACYADSRPLRHEMIAKELSLPRRYLEAVLQRLVRAGILKGLRGPLGGYQLARPAAEITVGDVCRSLLAADPEGDEATEAESFVARAIRPFWLSLRVMVMQQLDLLTIQVLAQRTDQLVDRTTMEDRRLSA